MEQVRNAIENTKKILSRSTAPLGKEKWEKACEWFKESVITYMNRKTALEPTMVLQLMDWMVDMFPTSAYMDKLVLDTFDCKNEGTFTLKTNGNMHFIHGHLERMLILLENYFAKGKKKRMRDEPAPVRELIKDFIKDCVKEGEEGECGDYLVFMSWTTWLYDQYGGEVLHPSVYVGRRVFKDLFAEVGGFELTHHRHNYFKGIKVQATKQTPVLPLVQTGKS